MVGAGYCVYCVVSCVRVLWCAVLCCVSCGVVVVIVCSSLFLVGFFP